MTIANPILLWALARLAIPITIHLLSRKEGRTLKLGSLRHIQETSTQQFRGIRLNEIALLLLRCALVALFSLITADLFFPSVGDKKWVVVEKGLHRQPRISAMIDSLVAGGYEAHWLINGFPDLGDSIRAPQRVNYRGLVIKLEQVNLSSAIVFACNAPVSFNGVGMPTDANIRWISQPSGSTNYTLQTVTVSADSVVSREGHTNANLTTFEYSRTEKTTPQVIPPVVTIGLITDKKYERDRKIVKAALRALDGMLPAKIIIEEDPAKVMTTDWRVWLSDKKPPTEKIIAMNPGKETSLVVRTGPSAWALTKRLHEYLAIESNLSVALADIIMPDKDRLEAVAAAHDRRMFPDSLAWSFNGSGGAPTTQAGIAGNPAKPFLLIVFLVVLSSERILAYSRKQ